MEVRENLVLPKTISRKLKKEQKKKLKEIEKKCDCRIVLPPKQRGKKRIFHTCVIADDQEKIANCKMELRRLGPPSHFFSIRLGNEKLFKDFQENLVELYPDALKSAFCMKPYRIHFTIGQVVTVLDNSELKELMDLMNNDISVFCDKLFRCCDDGEDLDNLIEKGSDDEHHHDPEKKKIKRVHPVVHFSKLKCLPPDDPTKVTVIYLHPSDSRKLTLLYKFINKLLVSYGFIDRRHVSKESRKILVHATIFNTKYDRSHKSRKRRKIDATRILTFHKDFGGTQEEEEKEEVEEEGGGVETRTWMKLFRDPMKLKFLELSKMKANKEDRNSYYSCVHKIPLVLNLGDDEINGRTIGSDTA